MKDKDGREYRSESVFAFNTIRRVKTEPMENMEVTLVCSVSPDGKSFTETTNTKSKIGLYPESKVKNTWSLTEDGNKLIIRSVQLPDVSIDQVLELPDKVFERVGEEE